MSLVMMIVLLPLLLLFLSVHGDPSATCGPWRFPPDTMFKYTVNVRKERNTAIPVEYECTTYVEMVVYTAVPSSSNDTYTPKGYACFVVGDVTGDLHAFVRSTLSGRHSYNRMYGTCCPLFRQDAMPPEDVICFDE